MKSKQTIHNVQMEKMGEVVDGMIKLAIIAPIIGLILLIVYLI